MVISEFYLAEDGYFSIHAELKNNTDTPVELLLNCFSQVGLIDKLGTYIEMPLYYNYEGRQSVKFDVCIEDVRQ
ncbi:hypothetical protein GCM10017783_22950 [Deinococcus piscis]|uniref:Uncharacterized protein n=1 Tax=Deinococcus piscis TaxID=394230 RepID=A0ABQ3KA50_9DEIO|nr:hypothetical protein GCM10017783_22950 [Deinococcus piscis]